MARLDNNFVLNSASNECLLGHVRDVKNKSYINNVFLVHRGICQYTCLNLLSVINHTQLKERVVWKIKRSIVLDKKLHIYFVNRCK